MVKGIIIYLKQGRMPLGQEDEDTFVCIPISKVQGILRRCAHELGMTYEQ